MLKKPLLTCTLFTAIVFVFTATPAWAGLNPIVQETGKISVSVDAIGTNAVSDMVQVDKP